MQENKANPSEKNRFIGEKRLVAIVILEEKTIGGTELVRVEYEDGIREVFSKLMYEAIVSDEACDLSALRDKRVQPVVATILAVLREWGIKTSELAYMSALLNQSLQNNEKEALKELWSAWLPTIQDVDEVDMITVDRVLRSKKKKGIPSPYGNPDTK